MRIGIIGAGNIGATLARKLKAAGHTIKLANSRGPQTLADLARDIGVSAVTAADTVQDVDAVIVTIPQKSITQLPKDLFQNVPDSVVVIDTGNYYPGMRDGPIEALEAGLAESVWVSQQLGRPVIKAFNSIMVYSLMDKSRPAGAPDRIALPVSGDDARAKSIVLGLINDIGFDSLDAGSLADSWRQQPGTPVYCTDYGTADVRKALALADRSRAPKMRDQFMIEAAKLATGATPSDAVALGRQVFGPLN